MPFGVKMHVFLFGYAHQSTSAKTKIERSAFFQVHVDICGHGITHMRLYSLTHRFSSGNDAIAGSLERTPMNSTTSFTLKLSPLSYTCKGESNGMSGRHYSMESRHGQLQNHCCPDLMHLRYGYIAEY